MPAGQIQRQKNRPFQKPRSSNITAGAAQNSRADVESICRNLGVLPDEKQVELAVQIRLDHIRQVMTPRPGATDHHQLFSRSLQGILCFVFTYALAEIEQWPM